MLFGGQSNFRAARPPNSPLALIESSGRVLVLQKNAAGAVGVLEPLLEPPKGLRIDVEYR